MLLQDVKSAEEASTPAESDYESAEDEEALSSSGGEENISSESKD